jgi:hypothetical protein
VETSNSLCISILVIAFPLCQRVLLGCRKEGIQQIVGGKAKSTCQACKFGGFHDRRERAGSCSMSVSSLRRWLCDTFIVICIYLKLEGAFSCFLICSRTFLLIIVPFLPSAVAAIPGSLALHWYFPNFKNITRSSTFDSSPAHEGSFHTTRQPS